LIISTALFSIVWGLLNVLLVKGVDMDDVAPIERACTAAAELRKDVESINAEEDEEQKSPAEILAEIKKIGVLITEGANSFLI
jgi:hypothetical protein